MYTKSSINLIYHINESYSTSPFNPYVTRNIVQPSYSYFLIFIFIMKNFGIPESTFGTRSRYTIVLVRSYTLIYMKTRTTYRWDLKI